MGERLDGRKLDHATLAALRRRAVLLVEGGEHPETVIRALGFHRSRIYDWLAKYREGGLEALAAKPVPGRKPKLTGTQTRRLCRLLLTKNPLQLRFPYALWTRAMVREVIREQFGVHLSEVSVGRMLRNLGLSPQRPLYRAYQQDAEAVDRWVHEEYPAIQRAAKRAGATIYFADESAVRSDSHSGTMWAPVGQTPSVPSTGARFRVNLISAVSAQGLFRFMLTPERFTAATFVQFCRRLLANADRPVYLVVDGHPTHRARSVREFVASTEGRLTVIFLPAYAPHLNPDEWAWNHIKRHGVGRATVTGPADLAAKLLSCCYRLQRLPAVVRGFFLDPHTRYAAG